MRTNAPRDASYTPTHTHGSRIGRQGERPSYPMSEPQAKLILALLTERVIDAKLAQDIREAVEAKRFDWARAKNGITYLMSLPRVQAPTGPTGRTSTPAAERFPEVIEGRYAVDTDEGHLAFYKVDRPTEGKWAGYVFVKVQASDDEHPIRGRAAADAILAKIAAAGVKAASERYGQELGSCSICGRTLTDETSRELGIGPVCRAATGWYA